MVVLERLSKMVLIRDPAFWDVFGFVAFLYIILFSVMLLKNKVSKAYIWILLLIGIVGAIVDFVIVYNRFFS